MNKQAKTIIIILSILILCLLGYIIYNKTSNKNQNETTTTTTIKEEAISDDDLKTMQTLIKRYYYVLWNKSNINELSNREIQYLGILKNAGEDTILKDIKANDMQTAANSLFYNKTNIKNEDITGLGLIFTCNDLAWKYDSNTQNYVYSHTAGHGACEVSPLYSSVVKSGLKNKEYTISMKYIMALECDGPDYSKLYGNLNDLSDEKNEVLTINGDDAFDEEKAAAYAQSKYEGIKNKLDTYTYTFVKDNNSFVLKDYSREKAS